MAWVNYKINNWLLITTENCLYKSGENYIIEPRITKLLAFLAKHQGIVFTRDELIKNVWDGAVVSEQVVTQSIFELRKTLKKMDEDHWIVTIPKRGYKLDIDVQQIYVDPNTGFKLEEFHSSHEHTNDVSTHTSFPAGPMTRAFNKTTKEAPSTTALNNAKWNHWFFDVCILSMLLITIVFITWSNEKITPLETILNPRLINIESTQQISPNQLYSIANIIKYSLFKSTDYISSFSHQPNAGKTLSLYVNKQHQLQITLFNNISKTIMLHKELHLNSNNSYVTIDNLINQLIQSLNYDSQKSQNNAHIILTNPSLLYGYLELPSVITNDGQTNMSYIEQINKLIQSSPQNSYLLAQRYLAYAIILTMNNKVTSMPTLMNYGKVLVKSITSQQQPVSSEIYDALALNELYQGNLTASEHYLSLAALESQQNTALRYILLGKISELTHKKQQANEYYNRAIYLDPSQETFQLCQKLVFISQVNTSKITSPH